MQALATMNGSMQAATITADLFGRWIEYLDAKPKTIATYTRAARQFINYMKAQGITAPSRESVISYRESLEQDGKSAATINSYIIAVRLFFRWTAQEGLYPNIADHVKGAKVSHTFKKDYLTSRQAKKLLTTCQQDTETGARDYAIMCLMATTGLRTIEVARANIEDMRPAGDYTVLYIQGKGRDDKQEYVKLTPPVEDAIRAYLSHRGKKATKTAPLFSGIGNRNAGGRMTTRTISRIVKGHLQEAGLNSDRLTAHSLRHTAATLMLKNGATPTEVQQILRHKDINTTMIYSHNLERENNTGESRAAAAIFG